MQWHTTTSVVDEQWTEDLFKAFGKAFDKVRNFNSSLACHFPNKNTDNRGGFRCCFGQNRSAIRRSKEPRVRRVRSITVTPLVTAFLNGPVFHRLKRGPDGKFDDDGLANILMSATENIAGQWRANGTPAALRIVEILGIEQARKWGVCTMNEFRQFMKLKQFKSFKEWNPDPSVARAAERLYGHIDNLELYPGLQCEATIPTGPGLWLPAGYTMMKAVLSDAIALVRGDRFYTTCFTPSFLTAWGYQDTKRDPNNGGLGGAFPKLLTRHLPRHYAFVSFVVSAPITCIY